MIKVAGKIFKVESRLISKAFPQIVPKRDSKKSNDELIAIEELVDVRLILNQHSAKIVFIFSDFAIMHLS